MAWDDLTENVMAICRDTFQTPILYTTTGQDAFESKGIFDAEFKDVVMLDGALVQSTSPRLGMALADLPNRKARKGDRVVVKGVLYRVIDFQPDGQSGVSLFLEKLPT